jgi:hypothetical protein
MWLKWSSLEVTGFQPKLAQHPVQGAGLQLVLQIPDDCEPLPQEESSMAPLSSTGYILNRQVSFPADSLDQADELGTLHVLAAVSDIFVLQSRPFLGLRRQTGGTGEDAWMAIRLAVAARVDPLTALRDKQAQ